MTAQLDIFGRPHPRNPQGRPGRTWQPSLVPPEVEAAANAEEMTAALERFRAACHEEYDSEVDHG